MGCLRGDMERALTELAVRVAVDVADLFEPIGDLARQRRVSVTVGHHEDHQCISIARGDIP